MQRAEESEINTFSSPNHSGRSEIAMADSNHTIVQSISESVIRADATLAAIKQLPFVRDATRAERAAGMPGRKFWAVASTGDYAADRRAGQQFAREALAFMVAHDFPALLGWIVRDMCAEDDDRHLGAVECGFLSAIARQAIGGAHALD
jgi:hypothetical protein